MVAAVELQKIFLFFSMGTERVFISGSAMQATHDRRMCKTRVACRPPPSTHVFADVSIGMLLGYFRLNFWALLLLSYCCNLLLLG